jgi:predicted MFS family arabinose efflux permease
VNAPEKAPSVAPAVSERLIILLVGAIQFVNVLDFMMVMPLGPDFAAALGIPTSQIGVVGGSYTAAAALAGVVGSLFLDRFDRRIALGVAMGGLVVGTALGGFAVGLGSLLLARIVAGAFGGPATSLSLAVIADAIPPARRGKAMGAVMGAFSLASVLGVPAGLELSARFGWRAPFFAVAGLGLLLAMGAIWLMPSMREHLKARGAIGAPKVPLLDSVTGISLANTALIMVGLFAVVPNISAFVQHNMSYPRDRIGMLYLVGGAASLVVMRIVGRLVDRFGATPLVVVGTALHAVALVAAFVHRVSWLPVLAIFVVFMLSGSVRMVPMQTLASRVPRPEQRARFMSAQSAVQHAASALGAVLASLVLVAAPDGSLLHMDRVALGALVVACLVPVGASMLERRVNARQLAAAGR